MRYTLRRSVVTDREKIEALFLQMLKSIYHTEDVTGYDADYLDKFYGRCEDWICVAETDGDVIGYLSIEVHREEDPPFLYLDDICVDSKYRSYGIGTAMLREADRFAREQDISVIMLHVERENVQALRLYQRIGYEILAEEGSRCRMIKKTDKLQNTT